MKDTYNVSRFVLCVDPRNGPGQIERTITAPDAFGKTDPRAKVRWVYRRNGESFALEELIDGEWTEVPCITK